MSITVRAAVHLTRGARLYYDCPFWDTDDSRANAFFRTHRGKIVTFFGYSDELIGPLDSRGRVPGRYIDGSAIDVTFDRGLTILKGRNIKHFIVLDPEHATFAKSFDEGDRLGDLPHPILFHPGDLVIRKGDAKKVQYEVSRVLLRKDGTVGYQIRTREHTREYEDQHIALVSRGNVWALYNDPDWLRFDSDEEEMAFWAHDGVSRAAAESIYPGISFTQGADLFAAKQADLIVVHDLEKMMLRYQDERGEVPQAPKTFAARRLHDCFAEHRERVRALTGRLWAKQLKNVK